MSRDVKQIAVIWGLVALLVAGSLIWLHIYTNTPSEAKSLEKAITEFNGAGASESFAEPDANKTTEVEPTKTTPQVQMGDNKQPAAAQPAQTEPKPAKTEPLERIPFTNKPVTPGNPESYVDTYGQCPFYENAGPKGCYPPLDIECNADWSVCTYKGN